MLGMAGQMPSLAGRCISMMIGMAGQMPSLAGKCIFMMIGMAGQMSSLVDVYSWCLVWLVKCLTGSDNAIYYWWWEGERKVQKRSKHPSMH